MSKPSRTFVINILISFVLNIFLIELWNDSAKTIRLLSLSLDFNAVIVDEGEARARNLIVN